MTRRSRLGALPAAGLAIALVLGGCGDDDPAVDETPTAAGSGAGSGGDVETAVVAIGTAEADAGGTAYGVDARLDGQWDVVIAQSDRSVEVTVSADGSSVVDTQDDDDDDEERARLQAASISLGDALRLADAEVDGALDDAELTDDDEMRAWEVSIDTPDREDVDVYIDIVTGEILDTKRD